MRDEAHQNKIWFSDLLIDLQHEVEKPESTRGGQDGECSVPCLKICAPKLKMVSLRSHPWGGGEPGARRGVHDHAGDLGSGEACIIEDQLVAALPNHPLNFEHDYCHVTKI